MVEPYCGTAPIPAELLGRWNFDPVLLATLVLLGGLHAVLLRRAAPTEWKRKAAPFAAAWFLVAIVFVSPFCALTSALFSARVAHHMILVAMAAPLFVLALPDAVRRATWSPAAIGMSFLIFTAMLWFWHAPTPYAAALANDGLFWAMELSLIGSAVMLWLTVLAFRADTVKALVVLLGTVVQMGLLGAVITFARSPLYAFHYATTAPWGLTALTDQQLAGLIMWVPAVLPYLIAALALVASRLGGPALSDRRV